MVPDAFGGWQVQGAMTVSLGPDSTCTDNPSEGASSFPLSTLTGTRAPAGSDAASVRTGAATVSGADEVISIIQSILVLEIQYSAHLHHP